MRFFIFQNLKKKLIFYQENFFIQKKWLESGNELNMEPYKIQILQELFDNDFDKRVL